jgi:hypothetical protein
MLLSLISFLPTAAAFSGGLGTICKGRGPILSDRRIIFASRQSLISGTSRKQATPYLPDSPTPYFPEEEVEDDSPGIRMKGIEIRVGVNENKQQQSNSFENREIKSVWQSIDDFGKSLKSRAIKANAVASLVKKPAAASSSIPTILYATKKLMFLFQSCLFFCGYMLYRGYRGVFVILPEVFRVTFKKLESAVEDSPFTSAEDNETNDDIVNLSAQDGRRSISESSSNDVMKDKRWRTRITVSLLSFIITMAYVFGGALRILSRIITTLRSSKGDVSKSFAAGVEEQEKNEKIIFRKFSQQNAASMEMTETTNDAYLKTNPDDNNSIDASAI